MEILSVRIKLGGRNWETMAVRLIFTSVLYFTMVNSFEVRAQANCPSCNDKGLVTHPTQESPCIEDCGVPGTKVNRQNFRSSRPPGQETIFDWRTTLLRYRIAPDPADYVTSPFFQLGNEELETVRDNEEFKPEDGWELITRDLGIQDNGQNGGAIDTPYFVLYNRFTSLLRVFFMVGEASDTYKAFSVELSSGGPRFSSNVYRPTASEPNLALDKFANTRAVLREGSPFTGSKYRWHYADFFVHYDPCVCKHKETRMRAQIWMLDSANIQIEGESSYLMRVGDNTPYEEDGTKKTLKKLEKIAGGFDFSYSSEDKYEEVFKSSAALDAGMSLMIANNNGKGQFLADAALVTSQKFSFTQMLKSKSFLKFGLKGGAVVAGASLLWDLFSGGSKKSGKYDQPSIVHNGMYRFKGGLSKEQEYLNISWWVPGSNNLDQASAEYPFYNQALGVFNLLKTPTMRWTNGTSQPGAPRFTFALDRTLPSIEYLINPASGFRRTNPDIQAAIVFELNTPSAAVIDNSVSRSNDFLIKESNKTVRTRYVPIACLRDYSVEIDGCIDLVGEPNCSPPPAGGTNNTSSNFKVFIKFLVNLERTNTDAETQNHLFVMKYPVDLVKYTGSIASWSADGYPHPTSGSSAQNMFASTGSISQNVVVANNRGAWSTFTITSSFTHEVAQSTDFRRVVAGEEIRLRPLTNGNRTVHLRAPRITGSNPEQRLSYAHYLIDNPVECTSTLNPIDEGDIQSEGKFCNQAVYKDPRGLVPLIAEEPEGEVAAPLVGTGPTKVFPNPANDRLIVVPSVSLGGLTIDLITNTGEVYSFGRYTKSSQIELDVSRIPIGAYRLRLTSARGVEIVPITLIR